MTERRWDKGSTFDSKDELNVEKEEEGEADEGAGWTSFTSFMMTRVLTIFKNCIALKGVTIF